MLSFKATTGRTAAGGRGLFRSASLPSALPSEEGAEMKPDWTKVPVDVGGGKVVFKEARLSGEQLDNYV